MTQLVLIERDPDAVLTRLLEALGAFFERSSVEEAFEPGAFSLEGRAALILPEEQLIKVHDLACARSVPVAQLFSNYADVLVYPTRGTARGLKVLSEWVGGKVQMRPLDGAEMRYSVSHLDIVGPFRGLQFGPANPASDHGLIVGDSPHQVEQIVGIGDLGFFIRVGLPSTDLFVACSSAVFDVTTESRRNLQAAAHFSELVPLILFLRHCQVAFWRPPSSWANVIIDDPDLQPRYGFVNAQKLARCVDELGCAVSIGFIPWNFKRASPAVVELFRSRWPRLSLCMHGCDHTEAEFCTDTLSASLQLIGLGLERMRELSCRTGLQYDRIIVFPQGKFSAIAMEALRQSLLLGAVNTELVDDQTGRGVRAGELLKPAITAYAGFPLFLRRQADEPIANFALDLLLGKPCLVVMHHDYFQNGMESFVSLVRSLNALDPGLKWTNPESIVSTTFSTRATPDMITDVRLFSASSRLFSHDLPSEAHFSKSELLNGKFFRVVIDSQETTSVQQNGYLNFAGRLNPSGTTVVEIQVSPLDTIPVAIQSLGYRLRVATRRYLSQIRDNHFARLGWATTALKTAQKFNGRSRGDSDDLW